MATKRLTKLRNSVRRKGNHIAKTTKAALSDAAYNVKHRFSGVQGGVLTYAKRNPLKTMGISVVTGMLIAQLLRTIK